MPLVSTSPCHVTHSTNTIFFFLCPGPLTPLPAGSFLHLRDLPIWKLIWCFQLTTDAFIWALGFGVCVGGAEWEGKDKGEVSLQLE